MTTRTCSVLLLALLLAAAGSASAAQLTGWTEVPTTAVDLTTEGALDWSHWGFNGDRRMNHKASGGGKISVLTNINGGAYGNDASGVNYVWNDGAPDASCAGTSVGVRIINTGGGVSFTVPADTSVRTVKVYITGHHSTALVRGQLSDGSAADWQDESFFSATNDFMAAYVMTYAAASAGQTLTVTLIENGRLGDWESVNLHAVTLRAGAVTSAAVVPPAPTALDAIPGDGQVALHWSRMSGINRYNLYRSTTSTPGAVWRSGVVPFRNSVTPGQATFLVDAADTTATNGQTWHYWVAAVNAAGEGPRSAEATATPVAAGTLDVTKTRFLKILPLGDSITYGSPDPNGGYRSRLTSVLASGGFNAKLVGSYTENSAGMTVPSHEGWPGRTIENIRDGVVDRAVGTYQPDVVLLMIGTNNLAWGDKNQSDVDNSLTAYDALITRIFTSAPNTNLIVSPILPMNAKNSNGSSKQPLVDNFNTALHAKVTALAGAGKRISWAAAMSAITVGQLGDGVHPTSATYQVLGDAWFTAIQALSTGTPTVQVGTPQFSPASGTFTAAQSVSLSCATSGAAIHYTTDGSTPTGSSPLYVSALTVSATTTVKALAQKSGMSDSAVTTATYTITPVVSVVSAPVFSPAGGTFTAAQWVTLSSATSGATIRFTTDGATPTGSSAVYVSTLTISGTTTVKALAQKSAMSDSTVTTATYTITSGSAPADAPTDSAKKCGIGSGLMTLTALSLALLSGVGYCHPRGGR